VGYNKRGAAIAIEKSKIRLRSRTFLQQLLRPAVRFVKFRILHVDDTPERIARGVAVGLVVAFSPFLGFHMIIALTMAALLKANKALAVAMVWLSNPLTLLPVYLPAYMVGRLLVGWVHPASRIEPAQVDDLLSSIFSLSAFITRAHTGAFWKEVGMVFGKIGLEVTVGGFVLGMLAATLGYIATYHLIVRYRAIKGWRRFRQHP
jgi:uncharacterized protein (DUF2062 family)